MAEAEDRSSRANVQFVTMGKSQRLEVLAVGLVFL